VGQHLSIGASQRKKRYLYFNFKERLAVFDLIDPLGENTDTNIKDTPRFMRLNQIIEE